VCNPEARASGKHCYDPVVHFVCPGRNLVCAKGRECIENPTLDTDCIFVDGPVIPQQRTAIAPKNIEKSPAAERPANPEQPRSAPKKGLLD